MKSVMSHDFSRVPQADIPRSSFNRSHGYKTTLDAGYLVPIFVDEALPGDTFNLSMTAFARLATPLKPFMDNMFMDSFFFAVPYRLLWDNWERLCGAQDNPSSSTDFVTPIVRAPSGTGYEVGDLGDYFGLPIGISELETTAFAHRAYNLIYNTWFRDENLQDEAFFTKGDGADSAVNYPLRRRGKRYDYFTSSLPWPQKGPAIELPLGTSAPILSATTLTDSNRQVNVNSVDDKVGIWDGSGTATGSNFYADLTQATAATINQLRQSFAIQKLYERDARGGTRYIEILKSHFGVTSPDARLQRPEYLGGGSTPVNINPIAQTSANTDQPTPQGNLAAMGTVHLHGHGFVKSFVEHCVVIGLVSVRADLNYQQGLNRMWSRKTRWDYYWPALSHIGEQAVLSKEIYCDGTSGDETVWGYQERFGEYRYKPSQITGQFRSNYSTPLDTWHLAQYFASRPVLGDIFIQEDPPVDRVIAVPSEPHFLFDSYMQYTCARPMPIYGVPSLIDHF